MKLRDFKTVRARREFLEKTLQVNLSKSGVFSLDETTASKKNCENMIGVTQIPLGIAGPLSIGKKDYFIPLATTEGALVASISRGCKAITESGGANTFAYKVGTTRGPVFYTGSLKKSRVLFQWVKSHDALLKKTAESTSSYLTYKKVKVSGLGDYVFLRFSFDTTDAMGMNMATIATQKIVEVIEKETGIKSTAVAGNFDIDKKPAWMNIINNRGMKAWADIVIKKEIVKNILKTTPEKIFDVWLAKCMLGSAMSGSLGFNAQFANVIAAFFIATGQDPAHVVEGSMGITTVKVLKNGDLYFSVYLPALLVGTIGGGTHLATQQEALQILDLPKKDRSEKFAEIITCTVLAGEISLLASLSEGSLGKAHQQLGRGNS